MDRCSSFARSLLLAAGCSMLAGSLAAAQDADLKRIEQPPPRPPAPVTAPPAAKPSNAKPSKKTVAQPPSGTPSSAAAAIPDAPAAAAQPGPALPQEPALTDAPSQTTDPAAAAGHSSPDAAPPSDTQPTSDAQPRSDSKAAPGEQPAQPSGAADTPHPHATRRASEDNPFPEDLSRQAASQDDAAGATRAAPSPDPAAPRTPQPDHGSAPGAAAPPDASGGSSSLQGLDAGDLNGENDKRSKHRKTTDPDSGMAYDPKLAAQDDKIADFYLKNGNAEGAYARYKEAAQHDAGDANAVFGLAESARQMNMLDEAASNYQTYLFAFPDGPKARAARKALADMRLQSKR
ncbi:MAG TPA: tetratricopeptide repeat protein [Acidisarcina sp.]